MKLSFIPPHSNARWGGGRGGGGGGRQVLEYMKVLVQPCWCINILSTNYFREWIPQIWTFSRITYLFGLLHFEKQKEMGEMTWAQVINLYWAEEQDTSRMIQHTDIWYFSKISLLKGIWTVRLALISHICMFRNKNLNFTNLDFIIW